MSGPAKEEDRVWLTTVQKSTTLIEAQIGHFSGKLTIRNTLPLGKGMGNSTAIVVAFAIEDIIDKGHSGIDFAAIWETRPIVITRDMYEFTDLPKRLQHGFLIDTGLPAEPTSIIIRRLKKRVPKEKILMDSTETKGNCTERLLSGEDPLRELHKIGTNELRARCICIGCTKVHCSFLTNSLHLSLFLLKSNSVT